MYRMTRLIYDELKNKEELKVFTEEREKTSEAWLQFSVKGGGSYRIRFISQDDDSDVAVRVFSLISVEEENIVKVLPTINQLNEEYRYVKFIVDKDGDVNIEYDYLLHDDHPEKSAKELVIRFVKIIDDSYPRLMRALFC